MMYDVGVAPEWRSGFQDRDTVVRVTSVTSGLEGALGIRLGSVGRPGWTPIPNSETGGQEKMEMIKREQESLSVSLSVTVTLSYYNVSLI